MLQKHLLGKQKPSLAAVHREVVKECTAQGLRAPVRNTVALRVSRLDPVTTARRRMGKVGNDATRNLPGLGGAMPSITAPLE